MKVNIVNLLKKLKLNIIRILIFNTGTMDKIDLTHDFLLNLDNGLIGITNINQTSLQKYLSFNKSQLQRALLEYNDKCQEYNDKYQTDFNYLKIKKIDKIKQNFFIWLHCKLLRCNNFIDQVWKYDNNLRHHFKNKFCYNVQAIEFYSALDCTNKQKLKNYYYYSKYKYNNDELCYYILPYLTIKDILNVMIINYKWYQASYYYLDKLLKKNKFIYIM